MSDAGLAATNLRLRLLLAGGALLLLIGIIVAATGGGSSSDVRVPLPGIGRPARAGDPFLWVPGHDAQFVARATAGSSHVLFSQSPGGVIATAKRVAAFRPQIDAAVHGTDINPDVVEGMVFVESAGRPYVLAGSDAASAAGLTQILAATGQSLLGMHIDLARSRGLLAKLGNAASPKAFQRDLRALQRADDRFSPRKALAATVRYLQTAEHRFGRPDLAVVSYHMGIGNLEHVLRDYNGGHPVPYAQLYFNTAPDHNPVTYRLLSGFGDQSSLYYWRVLGAVQVMKLYRHDRGALERLAALQTERDSAAAVLHPPDRTTAYADPAALGTAYGKRELVRLPRNGTALGLVYGRTLGEGARRIGVSPAVYRGLRPSALDLLVELGVRVRALSGGSRSRASLIVGSAVTDIGYQRSLGIDDPDALTGYTFSIDRRYASATQAAAFQSLLDRLQALNLIAWSRGSSTIEVTVASDASRYLVDGP
jgi:hypothetical protein